MTRHLLKTVTPPRLRTVLVLFVLTPLGFYTKFYHGPGEDWAHSYAGDILYPMFWFFMLAFLRPKLSPYTNAAIIFLFSTAVEFTQLLSNPFLECIRSGFLGRTLIGTGFVAMDILYYAIGCVLAVLLQTWLLRSR